LFKNENQELRAKRKLLKLIVANLIFQTPFRKVFMYETINDLYCKTNKMCLVLYVLYVIWLQHKWLLHQ